MRVLAINADPAMDTGNTARILQPFLDGLIDSGAAVELFYTRKLDIAPCLGEFNCWLRSPGKCTQQDDMQMLHLKLRADDVWVFATPEFAWGVAGPMKNIFDRMLPLVEPFLVQHDGHCSHALREGTPAAKIVLVSTSGFWEMDNFDPLLHQVRTLCEVVGFDFAGALLRPHVHAFTSMLEMKAPVGDILEAAKQAGRELAASGRISEETAQQVSRPLLPKEEYLHFTNQKFLQEMDSFAKISV